MLLAGAGAIGVAGAATYYRNRAQPRPELSLDDEEPEILDAPADKTKTWKESAGRDSGGDGYVFGDLSRGAIVRIFGKTERTEDHDAEAAGDAQHTQVQKLVREAVRLYRARGYCGSINMAQTVAYFNESVSVRVDGPAAGEPMPWEKPRRKSKRSAAAKQTADELAAAVAEEAVALALSDASSDDAGDVGAMSKHGQAGYVFTTLLARLERRAKSWEAIAGDEKLDPSLTQSAHIGFAIPVIKVGWGLSVSLTVSASSLLRWSEHEAMLAAIANGDQNAKALHAQALANAANWKASDLAHGPGADPAMALELDE